MCFCASFLSAPGFILVVSVGVSATPSHRVLVIVAGMPPLLQSVVASGMTRSFWAGGGWGGTFRHGLRLLGLHSSLRIRIFARRMFLFSVHLCGIGHN